MDVSITDENPYKSPKVVDCKEVKPSRIRAVIGTLEIGFFFAGVLTLSATGVVLGACALLSGVGNRQWSTLCVGVIGWTAGTIGLVVACRDIYDRLQRRKQ